MPQFTFFKMTGGAAVHSFDIEDFETIDQAKNYAALILVKSSYEAVEICQGEDCFLVSRDQNKSATLSL